LIRLHEINSLGGVRVPRLVQHTPEQRHAHIVKRDSPLRPSSAPSPSLPAATGWPACTGRVGPASASAARTGAVSQPAVARNSPTPLIRPGVHSTGPLLLAVVDRIARPVFNGFRETYT
jgi:hypothetical protein